MKRIAKISTGIIAEFVLIFATTAFVISDPKPDFEKRNINLSDYFSVSKIESDNSRIGTFKTAVKFQMKNYNNLEKEFYGQEIIISGNPNVDRILIGITNNLISRIEIWNNKKLVKVKEIGFFNKMTWGDTQTMTVQFYDETNTKYAEKSGISMRFFEGQGIFGDIGGTRLDLTNYGNFNGDKTIKLFSKSIDSEKASKPKFLDFKIWKNHQSFD